MRMVHEDMVSSNQVIYIRPNIEYAADGSVTILDREPETPGERGQVEREIVRNLTVVDEHLGSLAQGRSDGLNARLPRRGWWHALPPKRHRLGRVEPQS